jgi:hypothetical protein
VIEKGAGGRNVRDRRIPASTLVATDGEVEMACRSTSVLFLLNGVAGCNAMT